MRCAVIDINLLQKDLSEQISLVKSKQISLAQLWQQQSQLVDIVNPKVNAFISRQSFEESEQSAMTADSTELPLAGVAITVKDNIDVKGFNTTAGLETRRNNIASDDAFVIDKLRQAGAAFSGKLNMHEGALGASNQNAHYGNCYNPHQLDASPGGSSGGSGAAVASCMTPLALGTDTMGSVRIPASYCGVMGFKPSRGAVSNRGSVTCSRVMDNIGPIARSARDLTLAFSWMNGFDAKDAHSQAFDYKIFLPDNLQLLVPDNLLALGVEQNIIDDFERNLVAFKDIGCEIKYFSIGHYDFGAARRAGLIICEAEMRVEHEQDWLNNRAQFSPYLNNLLSYIDKKSPMDVIKSEKVLDNAVIQAREILAQGDFILMPTAPQRAFDFAQTIPANQADLTSLANQAGLPAVSIPMLTSHLLPAGMQIVGKQGSDHQLLSLAEKWQKHTEYRYQLPQTIIELLEVSK